MSSFADNKLIDRSPPFIYKYKCEPIICHRLKYCCKNYCRNNIVLNICTTKYTVYYIVEMKIAQIMSVILIVCLEVYYDDI